MRTDTTAPRNSLQERGLLELAEEVAEEHGVPLDSVLGKKRDRSTVRARHALWHRLYHHPQRCFSYPELGRIFQRDPTSVMYAVTKLDAAMSDEQRSISVIDGALQRAHAARRKALELLAADLRRIEAAAAELGVTLQELRDAD